MKTPHFGLLHHATDWKVLHDLSNKLIVPPFLAITELRPDVLLYSLGQKTCVIIELTCPCEENMEQWHSTKFHKYDPLCEAIKLKGWTVHLFPIEVGARGFSATTVKSCLSRLGFCGKLLKSTLKALSIASLKASFYIWVSRDSKKWEQPPIEMPNSLSSAPEMSSSCQSKKTLKPSKSYHQFTSVHPTNIIKGGLLNKGNTCYLNSCLQGLHVMTEFWSSLSAKNIIAPFTSSFLKIMSLLKSTKSPIDPSIFKKYLKQILIKSGRADIFIYLFYLLFIYT